MIYLIRHGQSEANVDKSVYTTKHTSQIELTEKGRRQSRELAVNLISCDSGSNPYETLGDVYVSPFKRTLDTYRICVDEMFLYCGDELNTSKMNVIQDPLLTEMDWGTFYSRETHEFSWLKQQYEANRFYFRFPHGDSWHEVWCRAATFHEKLLRIMKKDPNKKISIFGHGIWINSFISIILNESPEYCMSIRYPKNCSFHKINYSSVTEKFELFTELEFKA